MLLTLSFWADLFIALSLFYIFLLIVAVVSLLRIKFQTLSDRIPRVSVIIAARNEAGRIEATLHSMTRLDYPPEQLEVIWVDDASTDDTADIVRSFLPAHKNWRLLCIAKKDAAQPGKQQALMTALAQARGEIIAVTDADCRVPLNWLWQLVSCFDDQTVMVLGHALLEKTPGFLNRLLRFDNLFAGLMTALPTLWGFPLSSVGRNMAYRKDAYYKSGGYEALAGYKSGDDVHLTELFRRQVQGKIRFCGGAGSYVLSRPPETRKEIFQQQIRKNSKLLQKSPAALTFSFLLLAYHLLLIGLPFFLPELTTIWAISLATKLALEFIALWIAVRKLDERSLTPYLFLFQLIYPVYVIVLAALGSLGRFHWKR